MSEYLVKEKEALLEENNRLKKQLSIAVECIGYYHEVDVALQAHSNISKDYVNEAKVSLKRIKALEPKGETND